MDTLTKMRIEAFEKERYTQSKGSMTVQFNPATLNLSWGSLGKKQKKEDGTTQELAGGKFKDIKITDFSAPSASFKLIFDNTLKKVGKSVTTSIEKFKKLCLKTEPEVHGPAYIILSWGEFIFKCQLSSLKIEYVLFNPKGVPLRAEVNCIFKEFKDSLSKAKEEDVKSPDMTRVVTIREGDNLPLLCYRHYGSSRFYLKVAKANGLASTTYLRPGQRIVLPPLIDELNELYV